MTPELSFRMGRVARPDGADKSLRGSSRWRNRDAGDLGGKTHMIGRLRAYFSLDAYSFYFALVFLDKPTELRHLPPLGAWPCVARLATGMPLLLFFSRSLP
jgi:hypothetical protein